MIQCVVAPPRSGKSYFVVNYLVGFTKYDGLYNEYVLNSDVLIISNIEGLKIRHWTLKGCLGLKPHEKLSQADPGRVKEFFSIGNFENIMKKTGRNHVILCIDEAHELFPQGFKEQSVYEFFAYHGHIGLDVFLMTQGLSSFTRLFNPLFEFVVQVTPRSKKVSNLFTYKYYDLKGKFLYSKILSKKNEVFKAYKSFRKDEHNKPRSAVMLGIVGVLSIFLLGGWVMARALTGITPKTTDNFEVSVVEKQKNPPSPGLETRAEVTHIRFDTGPDAPKWRIYRTSGWITTEKGKRGYLIGKGVFIDDGKRWRRFDELSNTVEFFGRPLDGVDELAQSFAPSEEKSKG
jgi:hypothetical protein